MISRGTLAVLLTAVFLLVIDESSSSALNCLDEDGTPVDWYIAYKLNRDEEDPQDLVQKGLAYVYMSSASKSGWRVSEKSIGDSDTAVGRIYYSVYDQYKADSSNLIYINYNDEHPDGKTSFTKGHTKGLTAFNSDGGFWLIHSVPKFFPLITEGSYFYRLPQAVYSQSFICISLDISDANTVGQLLTYDTPYIYEAMAGESIANLTPDLTDVVNGKSKPASPWFVTRTVTSRPSGISFTLFGKSTKFGDDLYHSLVAPTLKTDLLTMTWMQGGKLCPSNCTVPYNVKNVESINIEQFPSEQSHGVGHCKMAVAPSTSSTSWSCVGDINRMLSQYHRAGGTACFQDSDVAAAFQSMVKDIEGCNSPFWHNYHHHYWRYKHTKPVTLNNADSLKNYV